MSISDNVKEWLWQIAVKKALKRLLTVGIAYLVSLGLDKYGIKIDVAQFQATAFVAIYAAMEVFRNYLKNKVGVSFL